MILVPFAGQTPQVDDRVWLAPTSTLIGRVTLGAERSALFGAVLRGDAADIVVGRRSNLQDNVVVHADPGYPARVGDGVVPGGSLMAGVSGTVRRELTENELEGIRANARHYVELSRRYRAS